MGNFNLEIHMEMVEDSEQMMVYFSMWAWLNLNILSWRIFLWKKECQDFNEIIYWNI